MKTLANRPNSCDSGRDNEHNVSTARPGLAGGRAYVYLVAILYRKAAVPASFYGTDTCRYSGPLFTMAPTNPMDAVTPSLPNIISTRQFRDPLKDSIAALVA